MQQATQPQRPAPATPRSTGTPLLHDDFRDDRARGRVIGTQATDGSARGGVDSERVLSIDHAALRIAPLMHPGWGKSAVSYGAFERRPGLAFAALLANGHNLSQTYTLESLKKQCARWVRGGEMDHPLARGWSWLVAHPAREALHRRLRMWYLNWRRPADAAAITENLAVGWFPSETPASPPKEGHALVVHATKNYDNGQLWARVAGAHVSAFTSVQNLPTYFVSVLRERGAAYYTASLAGSHGLGGYPSLRPIAIDPEGNCRTVHAGIHQSVLGEIGFLIDTRVYGVRAAAVDAWSGWCGTAHAADRLAAPPDAGRDAERGGAWRPLGEGAWTLDPRTPTGLVHAVLGAGARGGLVWRARDRQNFWRLEVAGRKAAVMLRRDGTDETICESELPMTEGGVSLQVLDDGEEIAIHAGGTLVGGVHRRDARLAECTGVGVWCDGPTSPRDFEAHPRSVALPAELDMGRPWEVRGGTVRVADTFAGAAGPLAGRRTEVGGRTWHRALGRGEFDVTGEGSAHVRASVDKPNPGRTFYAVDWDQPGFADLRVEITPPGSGRWQKQASRAGFIFWQDRANYISVNFWLDDHLDTTSISSFFCVGGFEDIYDAVWSCLGADRATWGRPFELRIACDGNNYLVYVDGEPVLHRRLQDVYPRANPLKITKVGLLANWEWGDDTGTVFRNFEARSGPMSHHA